MRALKMNTRI